MSSGFKHAIRQLIKAPGFAAVAILTLAFGIGACTAMFSLVDSVLIKPLPLREPGRLVWIENVFGGGLSGRTFPSSVFKGWREQSQSFTALAGYCAFFDYQRYVQTSRGVPEALRGVQVTDNFLPTLGIHPLIGRNFTTAECAFHGPPAVILSNRYWRDRFDGDRAIIGQTIDLNSTAYTVVGVLPPSFDFTSLFSPGSEVDLLVPWPVSPETAAFGDTLFGIGRLRPGVTPAAAQAELTVISERLRKTDLSNIGHFGAIVSPLDQSLRGRFRDAFWILASAVVCVLAIGCVNLSALLLARVNARQPEFAVRMALGAQPRHLVTQALVESFVLALAGGVVGIPLAILATACLKNLPVFGVPLLAQAAIDWPALMITFGLMTATGLCCSVLPVVQLLHAHRRQSPQDGAHQRTASRPAAAIRDGLIVAEITLACMLLIGAGLLFRSFEKLLQVDLGFQPEHAVAWRINPLRVFKTTDAVALYYDEMGRRISACPGVSDVGFSDTLPLSRNRSWGLKAKGVTYPPGTGPAGYPRIVDRNYIRAMRIPLLAGRLFDGRDDRAGAKTVVINQSMANRLWPNRSAIGQILTVYWSAVEWTVVGVVKNVRHSSLENDGSGELYFDYHQIDPYGTDMVVRSARPDSSLVPDIRAALASYDPVLPSGEFHDLETLVDDAVAPRRFITRLLAGFSAAALLLTAIGLYGVVAFSVSQRTREIGIRSALGAPSGAIIALFLRQGLRLILGGLVCGTIASLMLSHVLRALLFGIGANDPLTYASVAMLLAGIALMAAYLPARRATRVDPVVALRAE